MTDATAAMIDELVEREAKRSHVKRLVARDIVARRIGASRDTLDNIKRGRIKGLRHWIVASVRTLIIRELENEIAALTHRLETLRQCGVASGDAEIHEVQTLLSRAREVMDGMN